MKILKWSSEINATTVPHMFSEQIVQDTLVNKVPCTYKQRSAEIEKHCGFGTGVIAESISYDNRGCIGLTDTGLFVVFNKRPEGKTIDPSNVHTMYVRSKDKLIEKFPLKVTEPWFKAVLKKAVENRRWDNAKIR